jgi:Ca2+-binding EF-hand superfamily protein
LSAAAHEGHEHQVRQWQGAQGQTISGDFVTLRSDRQVVLLAGSRVVSRPLSDFAATERASIEALDAHIEAVQQALVAESKGPAPAQATPFLNFAKASPADKVALRWDDKFLYVESDGIPRSHELMSGITAWQQQLPLPQSYRGDNAWAIPLKSTPAKEPMSLKSHFFRGAVAVAANGIAIFNPIKNDGKTDTFTAGELDKFGGHCGRGDDYHYHITPLHLQEQVGKGQPTAYALDGYPICGLTEPDGSPIKGQLDACHGHTGPDGSYHYHASKTYPYLMQAFHGEVTEKEGQVDPQPRARSPRPALPPMQGARIVSSKTGAGEFVLNYQIGGKPGSAGYKITGDKIDFSFSPPGQASSSQSYSLKDKGGKGEGKGRGRKGGRKEFSPEDHARLAGEEPPPREESTPPAEPNDKPRKGKGGNAAVNTELKSWLAAHFGVIDADHDGVVTREELSSMIASSLQSLDADKNGRISAAELDQAGKVPMAGNLKSHLREVDADGDGLISADEFSKHYLAMFDRADRAQSGRITLEQAAAGGGKGGKGGKGKKGEQDGAKDEPKSEEDAPAAKEESKDDAKPAKAPGQGSGPRKDPEPPGGRLPWIAAHFTELDTDKNGEVSKAEMSAQVDGAMKSFDANSDGKISRDETGHGGRIAIGGFVKDHFDELDADHDGFIAAAELQAFADKMFTKADKSGRGACTLQEASARSEGKGEGKKGKGGGR